MASMPMRSPQRESKLPITSANSNTKTAQQFPASAPSSSVEPRAPVPSVDQLFTTLQDLYAGRDSGQSSYSFDFTSQEYQLLQERLSEDRELGRWYQEKVRFDWEPPVSLESKGLYVLRTPSSHRRAYFVTQLKSLITRRVEALVDRRHTPEQFKIADALKNVHQRDSPNITLRTIGSLKTKNKTRPDMYQPFGTKAPDAAFYHQIGDILPTLVLEVVFSQPQKALKALAQRHIIGSMHEIGCFIGFNLPSQQDSNKIAATTQEIQSQELATVSIWRRVTRREGDLQVNSFTCNLNAAPFASTSEAVCENHLELRLSDFLPKQFSNTRSSYETKIEIPFSELREALGNAQSTPDLSEISPALALATSSESTIWDSGEEPLPEESPAPREREFTAVEPMKDQDPSSMRQDWESQKHLRA
ncbi:hypothetical protein D0869_07080 [Hortaea werneckii]|uniref:Uncharacterized protein n=1 Tax=Hortaea werneckii TaxID=91943 RepID=A0A3M7BDB1_HORWE|nr:hypothetical protein KC334_g1100 [Hortaea werneckii]KAI7025242.1 hypothetical protein KC355_g1109 [Hortaea werneckii]KAI7203792.1 hypothetical protein KC324_g1084 [Hortaea werneckii]KAI7594901.1 hypothetical protein KC316_g862 [Hortaea werneckii]KAI7675246.1 hypothetical protein KC318_g1084 [Hortaea werneckii]